MAQHILLLVVIGICVFHTTYGDHTSNSTAGLQPILIRLDKILERLDAQDKMLAQCLHLDQPPRDCQAGLIRGWNSSGVYTISPDGSSRVKVYCEQELHGGGWMVFQRRQDGSVEFQRNWNDYKTGFGDLSGEFWLGNDNIHLLTRGHNQDLKVELTYNDETVYADYSTFWVDNEAQQYRLTLTGFSGAIPPGNALVDNNQSKFSTKDADNDEFSRHCSQLYKGGWWYSPDCGHSNLNGIYGRDYNGISWDQWKGFDTSLSGTRMMVKSKP